jgi:hypothetical protein
MVGDKLTAWESQPWVFSRTKSGARWTFTDRNVSTRMVRQADGTYVGVSRGSTPRGCSIPYPKKTTRTLSLSVSGEPDATAINGSLVISWRCVGTFVARLSVTGPKSG